MPKAKLKLALFFSHGNRSPKFGVNVFPRGVIKLVVSVWQCIHFYRDFQVCVIGNASEFPRGSGLNVAILSHTATKQIL